MQQLQGAENKIFDLFLPHVPAWEENGLNEVEIQKLYGEATRIIEDIYKRL